MSESELMPCWDISMNHVGMVCMHVDEYFTHALQQVMNGWLFEVIDPLTGDPVVVYIVPDTIAPNDVAGAQHFAHRLIDDHTESVEHLMTYYTDIDQGTLEADWCGPDPMGGYGRIFGDTLFLINGQVADTAPSGSYMMQAYTFRGPRPAGETFGNRIRMIEGGPLDDVQRRAYDLALNWYRT